MTAYHAVIIASTTQRRLWRHNLAVPRAAANDCAANMADTRAELRADRMGI